MSGTTMTAAPAPAAANDDDDGAASSAGISSASSKRERELEDENDMLRAKIASLTGESPMGEEPAPGAQSGLTPQ